MLLSCIVYCVLCGDCYCHSAKWTVNFRVVTPHGLVGGCQCFRVPGRLRLQREKHYHGDLRPHTESGLCEMNPDVVNRQQ
jgi:hypothetical protein